MFKMILHTKNIEINSEFWFKNAKKNFNYRIVSVNFLLIKKMVNLAITNTVLTFLFVGINQCDWDTRCLSFWIQSLARNLIAFAINGLGNLKSFSTYSKSFVSKFGQISVLTRWKFVSGPYLQYSKKAQPHFEQHRQSKIQTIQVFE